MIIMRFVFVLRSGRDAWGKRGSELCGGLRSHILLRAAAV